MTVLLHLCSVWGGETLVLIWSSFRVVGKRSHTYSGRAFAPKIVLPHCGAEDANLFQAELARLSSFGLGLNVISQALAFVVRVAERCCSRLSPLRSMISSEVLF